MATVLVVDDEAMVVKLCTTMLQSDHVVLEAAGWEQALQVLQKTAPDLVLLDVIMPGMNGVELGKRIESIYPNTKVMLMTGYAHVEIEKVTGGNNPYRIIWKPFTAESLLRMIENVLGDAGSTPGRHRITGSAEASTAATSRAAEAPRPGSAPARVGLRPCAPARRRHPPR